MSTDYPSQAEMLAKMKPEDQAKYKLSSMAIERHDNPAGIPAMPSSAAADSVLSNVAAMKSKADDITSMYPNDGSNNPADDQSHTTAQFNPNAWALQLDLLFRSSGGGGYYNQIQHFCVGLDRFHRNVLPGNTENVGFTFITRPRLCLQSSNLRQDRIMQALDTENIRSPAFMIRALLDTKWGRGFDGSMVDESYEGLSPQLLQKLCQSPMYSIYNPFLTPICNGLQSISGYPDPTLETYGTEPGFFSEVQSYPIGYDFLNRPVDLMLNIKDVNGGINMAIFYFWLQYMGLVTRGNMMAYKEDIDLRRMNFTFSIYRFTTDATRTKIIHWSKATGCFIKTVPLGGLFNINEGETNVSAAAKFSIPVTCNKIECMDYSAFVDFNRLVERYAPWIEKPDIAPELPNDTFTNYMALPYIAMRNGQPVMTWRAAPHISDLFDPKALLEMMRLRVATAK